MCVVVVSHCSTRDYIDLWSLHMCPSWTSCLQWMPIPPSLSTLSTLLSFFPPFRFFPHLFFLFSLFPARVRGRGWRVWGRGEWELSFGDRWWRWCGREGWNVEVESCVYQKEGQLLITSFLILPPFLHPLLSLVVHFLILSPSSFV